MPRSRVSHHLARRYRDHLNTRTGRANSFAPCSCDSASGGMAGLGDSITDALSNIPATIAGLKQKGEKLENALKLIVGLSAVAAGVGILNLLRRRA